jgi:hypothetical protein
MRFSEGETSDETVLFCSCCDPWAGHNVVRRSGRGPCHAARESCLPDCFACSERARSGGDPAPRRGRQTCPADETHQALAGGNRSVGARCAPRPGRQCRRAGAARDRARRQIVALRRLRPRRQARRRDVHADPDRQRVRSCAGDAEALTDLRAREPGGSGLGLLDIFGLLLASQLWKGRRSRTLPLS